MGRWTGEGRNGYGSDGNSGVSGLSIYVPGRFSIGKEYLILSYQALRGDHRYNYAVVEGRLCFAAVKPGFEDFQDHDADRRSLHCLQWVDNDLRSQPDLRVRSVLASWKLDRASAARFLNII